MGTVHGEELPYLFGAPLVDGFNHFPKNYTRTEISLSESFMIYISNFARTGWVKQYTTGIIVIKVTDGAGNEEQKRV